MEAGMRLGLIVAVAAGGMFAIIVTFEGAVARVVGGFNASVLEHLFSGTIAVVALGILLARKSVEWESIRPVIPLSIVLGFMVFAAVAMISFAVPHTGVALGNFSLVFGQLVLAVLIDTVGFGGLERVPLSPQRIIGLMVMLLGIYLVFPKNG